jgi:hypothetical protein
VGSNNHEIYSRWRNKSPLAASGSVPSPAEYWPYRSRVSVLRFRLFIGKGRKSAIPELGLLPTIVIHGRSDARYSRRWAYVTIQRADEPEGGSTAVEIL